MNNKSSRKSLRIIFFLVIAVILPFSGCLPDGFTIEKPFLREGNPSDIPDMSGTWRRATPSSEDDKITVEPTEFKNTFLILANNKIGFKIIVEHIGQNNFIVQFEAQTNEEDPTPRLFLLNYTHERATFPEFKTDIDKINVIASKYGVTISEEGQITQFRSEQDLKLFFIDVANLPLTGENSLFDRI